MTIRITDLRDPTPDPDDIRVPFRKHRGKSLMDLARESDGPGYLRWARQGTDWGHDHAEAIDIALRTVAVEKINAAPPITLTDHQQNVADALLENVTPGGILLLNGGAGYGKSFVTKAIGTELIRSGYTVAATAVSYVATQVLANQLDPYGIPAATLARTLKFQKRWEEGKEVYDHSDDTPFEAAEKLGPKQALIIDECSMINDRDAGLLTSTVRNEGGLLIVVGDSAQLPPVKQEHLSAFCTPRGVDFTSSLTVPMRYSEDSDLYRIEQTVRNDPWQLSVILNQRYLGHDQVQRVTDMDDMLDAYVRNYNEDPAALHRMLLFRRAEVVAANNAVRKALFGSNASLVEEDEQLMILATTDTPYEPEGSLKAVRYYSGQTFRVVEAEKADYRITINGTDFSIPHYLVQLDDYRPPVRVIFGVTEHTMDKEKFGSEAFQAALSAAADYGKQQDEYGRKTGSWDDYKRLQSDFVRVAYTYATSVHRAQGQTVDYAYCRPSSLLAVRGIMGRALAYVACTRAKKRLTVLN